MSSWIFGKMKIKINMVSTAASNKKKSLFVLSVNGMIVIEALVVLRNFSQLIATKIEETLSQVHGWVNGNITIAVVRSNYRRICGASIPPPLQDRELE